MSPLAGNVSVQYAMHGGEPSVHTIICAPSDWHRHHVHSGDLGSRRRIWTMVGQIPDPLLPQFLHRVTRASGLDRISWTRLTTSLARCPGLRIDEPPD